MRTKILIILLVIVAVGFGTAVAQPAGRFIQLRERINNARLNEIANWMQLEINTVEKLRPIYLKYEKEKMKLMDGGIRRNMDISADSLTDGQAEKLYFSLIEKAKKMIALREKYYPEFRTVLNPSQIIMFQRIEGEINRKMLLDIRKRLNQKFQDQ